MLLVVFGAGASFDSTPLLRPGTSPDLDLWRPPLANDLFGERPGFRDVFTSFPQVVPLATRLGQASPEHPLERILTALRDEADEYAERHSQLAAVRYYLQQIIWECERYWLPQHRGATSYVTLLDQIQRWRRGNDAAVMFATFNYDRLLEYAASYCISGGQELYNNRFTSIDSYTQPPHFPVIKLHGSIDWGYRVDTPLPIVEESNRHVWQIAAEVIRRFHTLQLSTEIEKTVERPPQPQGGHAYVPALAIPLDQKTDFACPPNHLVFFRDRLASVHHILAIGWRGTEAHFCEMLRANLPSGVCVRAVSGTEEASEETLSNLRAAGVGGAWEASSLGFADFVVSSDLGSFLDQALRP